MDLVGAFLAGCDWPWAGALPLLIAFWLVYRDYSRRELADLVAQNGAGGLCRHARPIWRNCPDCASDFVTGAKLEKSSARELLDQAEADLKPMLSLWIDAPGGLAPARDLTLEVSTGADWVGEHAEIGVKDGAGRVCFYPARIPVGAEFWPVPLYGKTVEKIYFLETRGITRIRLALRGAILIEAPADALLEIRRQGRTA